MTEQRFEELVNLYLDREITPEQLKELRTELAQDPDLHAAFIEQLRLEIASRKALFSETRRSLMQQHNRADSTEEPNTSITFGFLRWCTLCTCILLVGMHWMHSTQSPFSLQRWNLFESIHADDPPLQALSIADIVHARDSIIDPVFQKVNLVEVSPANVSLPDVSIIEKRNLVSLRNIVADAEHPLARPLEIYPFYGNIRQEIPRPTRSTEDFDTVYSRPSRTRDYYFYSAGH